jgi:sugar phosphate isomerase/epimerase
MIDRREFVGAATATVTAGLAGIPRFAHSADAKSRIGVTTVGFRERFSSTASVAGNVDLDLLRWPSFVRTTFDVPYVEAWSRHFSELSLDYCEQLRRAASDAGTEMINIQLDPFPEDRVDMAAVDDSRRLADIEAVKRWMDRSLACGAPFLRANTDVPVEGRPFDRDRIADSFRRLAEYGETIGVTVLVENHTGYSRDIAVVEAIVRAVDHSHCRGLADWGNSPGSNTAERIESLRNLTPLTALVSAKGKTFDESDWTHSDYDVAEMTRAFERAGYSGVYSIELYEVPPPSDPVAAVHSMIEAVCRGIDEAAV